MADEVLDPAGLGPGRGDDEGHPERRVVSEIAVIGLAVVAQGLAVVPGQDDGRPALQARLAERVHQPPDLGVDVGHFAGIGVVLELGGIGFGRRVGVMRVPEMDPAEPFALLGREPLQGGGDGLPGRPLRKGVAGTRFGRVVIVVDVEALVEAETRIEREAADESARGVAAALEELGQGLEIGGHDGLAVLGDAVGQRRHAQEDVRVRRQGLGIMREGPLEEDALRGQGVDPGRPKMLGAVAAQAVRPQRVDRYDKEVQVRAARSGGQGRQRQPGGESQAREGFHRHFAISSMTRLRSSSVNVALASSR